MQLEDDIRKAVLHGVTLSDIGKHIKETPVLTSMGNGKEIAAVADFAHDPDHEEDFIRFWKYEAFAYWKIRETQHTVLIAGIAWDDQQNSTMFYAIVLPPR